MTDREERQHVIEILQKEKKTALHDNKWAFDYAIASIKTDLKYDLLYEETSGHADKQADKPITQNCESCRYYGSRHKVCNYCYKCSLWTEQEPTTKNDLAHNLCGTCINYKCEFQSGIVRTKCAFYMPPTESNCSEIPTGSTTKDYLGVDAISRQAINGYIDYILSHGMGKRKSFEFIKKFVANLPPTTSQEPCKDCISRQALIDWLKNWTLGDATPLIDFVNSMPAVTPQLSSGLEKLEKDFGESDCISRADAIKAIQDKAKKLTNEDTINGLCGAVAILFDLPSVTPQEPILDKIRAEIENHCGLVKENHCRYCSHRKYCSHRDSVMEVREILEIIDKAGSEDKE